MGGHPSRPAVAGRLERSTRRHRAGSPRTPAQDGGGPPSLLDLAPGGVYRATPVTRCAVVSYTAVSPLPVRALAVCSLWHCPAGRPGSLLATTLPCGARTFLGGGFPRRRDRPADSSVVPDSLRTVTPACAHARPGQTASRPFDSAAEQATMGPADLALRRRGWRSQ